MGIFSLSCNKRKSSKRSKGKKKGGNRRRFGSKKRVSRRRSRRVTRRVTRRRKYGSNKRRVNRRRSRRVSRRVSRRRSFGKRRRTRRFSASPNLNRIMGNYSPAEMNTFQEYTGAGTKQRATHFDNIPKGLRNNFYI